MKLKPETTSKRKEDGMCIKLDVLIAQEMMGELSIPEELKEQREESAPEKKELVTA